MVEFIRSNRIARLGIFAVLVLVVPVLTVIAGETSIVEGLPGAGPIGAAGHSGVAQAAESTQAVVPRYSVTLSSSIGTITATQSTIMRAATSPRNANQHYVFLRGSVDGRHWRRVARMTWNTATQKYCARVRPAYSTYYRAYWYDGAGNVRAISNRTRVMVRVRLRFYSSSYTFGWGRRVRFFGSVWPNHYRQKVRVQIRIGSRWVPLFWARLGRRGGYSTRQFKPRLPGSYRVRAVFYRPDWTHLGNQNGPKTLTVQRSTFAPEGRAVWVTRFSYLTRRHIRRIMRNAWEANLNTVYFQVRGQGDAFYRSHYEPWASRLAGRLGRNPGWDPLRYAISTAHAYGLKLHAWVNVYPIWMGTTAPPVTTPRHIYYAGSGWRVATRYRSGGVWRYRAQRLNTGYLWGTPGNTALRTHIKNVVIDIASNYDVDGIHLDKVRYPGGQYSWDRASRVAYAAANEAYKRTHHGKSLSRAVWQRRQVSALVHGIYDGVKDVNPEIQVSAACYGLYTNRFDYDRVTEGLRSYYEDSQGWANAGIVDTLVPMTFWDRSHTPKFSTLVSDFVSHRNGRNIYAGIAAYLVSGNWGELSGEVAEARSNGAQGVSFMDYRSLGRKWTKLSELFPEMVDPPVRGENSLVSMITTNTAPAVDETITLLCGLSPRFSGARISVMRYASARWEPVGTATTDIFGQCGVPFVAPVEGRYVLRAIFRGDGTYAPAVSQRLVVNVHP